MAKKQEAPGTTRTSTKKASRPAASAKDESKSNRTTGSTAKEPDLHASGEAPAKRSSTKSKTKKSTPSSRQPKKSSPSQPEKDTAESVALAEAEASAHNPSYEAIRQRAYEIYQKRGGSAPGNPDDDWLQAERELRGRKH